MCENCGCCALAHSCSCHADVLIPEIAADRPAACDDKGLSSLVPAVEQRAEGERAWGVYDSRRTDPDRCSPACDRDKPLLPAHEVCAFPRLVSEEGGDVVGRRVRDLGDPRLTCEGQGEDFASGACRPRALCGIVAQIPTPLSMLRLGSTAAPTACG
jgi:hypothetical protein